MSIRKRSWTTRRGETKEAWIVDYSDQLGERHIRTFGRKKNADAYHATVKVDVRAGVHTSGKATVAEAGRQWIADAAGRLEPATVESYQGHLDAHIIPYVGAVKLSELTVPLVRNFMDKLKADGRSPAMIKRVVGDLGSILADAQERGMVAQNVVRSLSQRKKRHETERRHKPRLKAGVDIPTPDEIRAIVTALQGRWRSARGVEVAIFSAGASELIAPTMDKAKEWGATALNVLSAPLFSINRRLVIERAAALGLPAIYELAEMAEEGGLTAYGRVSH
jgi:hypothetical protein